MRTNDEQLLVHEHDLILTGIPGLVLFFRVVLHGHTTELGPSTVRFVS